MTSTRTNEDRLGSLHPRANALGAWVVRRHGTVLLISLAVAGLAALGIPRVRISQDTRIFFREANPDYQAFRAFEADFGRSDGLVFLLAPKTGDVFSPHALSVLTELTDAAWNIPYARRVVSLARYPVLRQEGDDLRVTPLLEPSALETEAARAEARRTAESEGAVAHRLVSADGQVASVFVDLEMPSTETGVEPDIAEAARRTAQTFRDRYPDMDIRLTGTVLLADAFGEASRRDLRTRIPIMFLMMALVLGLSLRSLSGLIAAGIALLLSVATGLGLAGWMGIPLTAVSVSGPGLIVTLAVADCVHLLGALLQSAREGNDTSTAVQAAIRNTLRAVFLTSATTAIGFFSLNFSDSPPFRHLGTIVGMGITAAFFYAIFFVPALMCLLPIPPARPPKASDGHRRMVRFATWVIRRPRRITAGIACVMVLTAFGLPRIQLDDNFFEYFNHTFAVRRDTDFLIRTLGGATLLEYVFDAGETGGVFEPSYLETIDRFSAWQHALPDVASVRTLAGTLKRVNREMGDLPEDRLPETREGAAQILFLYEMALPPDYDLGAWVNLDRSASRVQVVFHNLSAREVREAERAAQAWLHTHAPPHLRPRGTGLSLMWAHITHRNIRSMLGGSFLALTLISLLLGVPLRNFRLGLISLVPNLLPPLMALGLWGLFRQRIGLALSVVVAMTIGIVVDDTIHFLIHYQRARTEQNASAADAVLHVFRTVGTALCTTTAALVAGCLVLATSPYQISAEIGLLCAIVLALALALDLLLLPALLLWPHRK